MVFLLVPVFHQVLLAIWTVSLSEQVFLLVVVSLLVDEFHLVSLEISKASLLALVSWWEPVFLLVVVSLWADVFHPVSLVIVTVHQVLVWL